MGTRGYPLEHCNDLAQLDEYLMLQNAVDIKNLPRKGDKDLALALHSQKRKCGKRANKLSQPGE
jgi:hypothetical protein